MLDLYAITIDVDWAPDYAIAATADYLRSRAIKATWFVSHDSPGIRRLLEHPELFELGLHPNFLSGSSHGTQPADVMEHISGIVPNAKIMRTHALVQSTPILAMAAARFGIDVDVSLFIPGTPHLQPHMFYFDDSGKGLVRIPYFWEDDIETYSPNKCWGIDHPKYHVRGLKIFNFHPTYVYLNCDDLHAYENVKKSGYLADVDQDVMDAAVNRDQPGVRRLFEGLCDLVAGKQENTFTISEMAEQWKRSNCQ